MGNGRTRSRTVLLTLVSLALMHACDGAPSTSPDGGDPLAVGARGRFPAPSGTSATPLASDRVEVRWVDNATNEGGFRVERSTNGGTTWVTAGPAPANSVTFVDVGRTPEVGVCYRVIAVPKNGNSTSSPSEVACTTPPAAPTRLTAVPVGMRVIDLGWVDASGVEDGYALYRYPTASPQAEQLVAQLASGATSYRDGALSPGTAYSYRVRATKDRGFGSYSNVAAATTPSTLLAPTGVDAVATGDGTISIVWRDNSTDEQSFRVERAPNAEGPWEGAYTTGPDATQIFEYGRPLDVMTCYRVLALAGDAVSPPSSVDCATPVRGPTGLTATADAGSAIELSWTDNSSAEDGYEVERDFVVVAVLGANATFHRDEAPEMDRTYIYRVRARSGDGRSLYSNYASGVAASARPAAPTWLDAYPTGSTVVSMSWTDNATNEAGVRVERSPDGESGWVTAAVTSANEYWASDGGRDSDTRVCYRAVAFNGVGESAPSNVDCTTPPAAPSDAAVTPEAVFTWQDNSSSEDGYNVIYCGYEGCYYVTEDLPPDTESFQAPWFYVGYAYYVVARKDYGESDWSFVPGTGTDLGMQTSPRALLKAIAKRAGPGERPGTLRVGPPRSPPRSSGARIP